MLDEENGERVKKNEVVEQGEDAAGKGVEKKEWDNPIEFMMTCIGFAVGLGNIWRFPMLCFKNGGCAFVIAFLIMLFLLGTPIYFLEVTIAQYSGFGAVDVWKAVPPLRGIGICSLLIASIISIYYNVLIAYSIIFFICSFIPKLPWDTCDFYWNDAKCCRSGPEVTCLPGSEAPSKQFFEKFVLEMTEGIEVSGGINWKVALALLLAWLLTFLALIKGVSSLGKVSYVTAIFPYFVIIALIIRGVTLDGAMVGIEYYILRVDWDKFLTAQMWIDATTQVYFCLGLIQGGIYTLGRHNNFKYNHQKTCLIVAILDGLTGILAGFAIFSVLGYMSKRTGIPVPQLAVGGPGLSFQVYPEALALMPFPWVFCVLFFSMMIIIGFGSILGLTECVLDTIGELFPRFVNTKRKNFCFRLSVCMLFFLCGLWITTGAGIYVQNLLDSYAASLPVIICVALEAVGIGWIYGIKRFRSDLKHMLGKAPSHIWTVCFVGITPILALGMLLLFIIKSETVKYNDYKYPDWAHAIGWTLVAVLIAPLVYFFFTTLFAALSKRDEFTIKTCLKMWIEPAEDWKPNFKEETTELNGFVNAQVFQLDEMSHDWEVGKF